MTWYWRDLDSSQRTIAIASLRRWHDRDGTPREGKALMEAEITESGIRNLNYGDGTSVGVLQLISDNGTRAQRLNILYCVDWFLDGARQFRDRPGSAGDLAGWVQRPAAQYLYRYATHDTEADDIIHNVVEVQGPATPPAGNYPTRPRLEDPPPNIGGTRSDYSEVIRSASRNHSRGGGYLLAAGRAIHSIRG